MQDDDPKLAILSLEYQYLCDIRHQHIGAYVQTNFYFGVLLIVIGGAITMEQEWALLAAPLIVFIQMSIIQWNQYHHFLTEEYLNRLENYMRHHCKADSSVFIYHGFYRHLFFSTTYLKSDKSTCPIIKPTALLTIAIGLFNIAVLILCVLHGRPDFVSKFGDTAYIIYLGIISIFASLLLYNFILMPKKLRPALQSYLERYIKNDSHEPERSDSID